MTAPHSVPEAAQHLLDLANSDRAKAGLGPLASRGDVSTIALEHSFRMVASGNIFHNDLYFSDATRQLLNSKARGENVAQNSSVDDTHARLMNSPGHRANILDARFTIVGFAVVQASDGRYYTTQDFLQPAGSGVPVPAAAAMPAAPRKPATAVPARSAGAIVAAPPVVSPPPSSPPMAAMGGPTGGVAVATSPVVRTLIGDKSVAASSARSHLPSQPRTETWLTAGLLLSFVALGTARVGFGAGRSASAIR